MKKMLLALTCTAAVATGFCPAAQADDLSNSAAVSENQQIENDDAVTADSSAAADWQQNLLRDRRGPVGRGGWHPGPRGPIGRGPIGRGPIGHGPGRWAPRPGWHPNWRYDYGYRPFWWHPRVVFPIFVWAAPVGYYQCTAFNSALQGFTDYAPSANQAAYGALYQCGGPNYQSVGCYIPQGYCQFR